MKKLKMPTAYTILFIIVAVVAALTWIVPAGKYVDGAYQVVKSNPQGIYNVVAAPIEGFFDAIDIAVFVIIIGGFVTVVLKTGAIDAAIGSVIKNLRGKEIMLIPILMILFGLGGTTFGMAEETIAFYPILIPVFIAAGYDTVTAVAVIMVGSGIGCLASTVNPFATGAASAAAKISVGEGIGLRTVMLILLEVISILYVMKYAKSVKEDPSKSLVFNMKADNQAHFIGEQKDIPEITSKNKVILWLFGLTFVIMILGVIPWASKFNFKFFDNVYNWVSTNLPFMGLQSNLLDSYWDSYDVVKTQSAALGDWWFGQMSVLFFVMSLIIGKVHGMKEEEFVATFIEGTRDLIGVALIIGVSRGIKIVMTAGGMDATVLFWGEKALQGLPPAVFTVLSYVFYIPLSFLIPSTSGLANASMPIMAPLASSLFQNAGMSAVAGKALVITAYQSASGIVNLITPTSGVIMGGLAIARLPYNKWLKFCTKLLVIIFIASVIILAIGTLL